MENDLQNELPLDEMAVMQEPPIDIEDTPASGIQRYFDAAPKTDPRRTDPIQRTPKGKSWVNWLLSGAALLITVIAGVLYLQQGNAGSPQPTQTTQSVTIIESTPVPPTKEPTVSPTLPSQAALPGNTNVPLDVVAELLQQPGDSALPPDRLFRQQTAYTIAPARTRAGVIEYKIEPGDTLEKIGQRFGISTDTIAWANDDIFVNRLQPGDSLTILPENGILYKTQQEETIQSIADTYKVSPYVIIDSEYNRFQNANPGTLLPVGLPVIVPGGKTEQKLRFWSPPVQVQDKSGKVSTYVVGNQGLGTNSEGGVSFGGGSGSCGFEPNKGDWHPRVPLPGGYTVIRGFFPGHSGIDLAMPVGTTVFAASSGTVIFAGWSNWGYGNSIVLAHGDFFTLYGHLSSISVRCGQYVNGGQPIGAVGTTGNSTGPHLHFEIRPNGVPANPVGYMAF